MAELILNPAAIRNLMEGADGPVVRDLTRRGQRVLNMARTLCPVDEGRLRASLTMEVVSTGGSFYIRVGSNLDYAIFVHEGTGIYVGRPMITAKGGGLLRWPAKNNSGSGNRRYSGGSTSGYVYARKVRGQPPQPFLRDALNAAL